MPVVYESRLGAVARELPDQVDEAVENGASLVRDRARMNLQMVGAVDEGELLEAIHTERRGRGEWLVVAGNRDAWYGHLVEHGSVHRPGQRVFEEPRRLRTGFTVAPRPFLLPALEASRDEIERLIGEGLGDL